MNKTRVFGIYVAMLFVAIGGSSAMAVVTQDSTTWEGSYEADVMPPVDNWVAVGELTTQGSIVSDGGNNYIHMPVVESYDAARSVNYVANPGTNGGASFELRARYAGGDAYDSMLGHIMTTATAGDTHYYWLTYYIHTGEIEIYNSNGQAPGQGDASLDVSQWRTYRFTMDGTNWNLYVDDNLLSQATLTAYPNADEGTPFAGYFGWFWGTTGTGDLDYLRYTDGGALAPIPEPATLGLLALGGLLGLRRRKR